MSVRHCPRCGTDWPDSPDFIHCAFHDPKPMTQQRNTGTPDFSLEDAHYAVKEATFERKYAVREEQRRQRMLAEFEAIVKGPLADLADKRPTDQA